ncbi:MAG: hypothetical protein F4X40_09510 [Chloroflexi bacterium]|nr:hypothetical protein [Chloroflexota bacterium]
MSNTKAEEVLVFPRSIFNGVYSLLFWDAVQDQVDAIETSFAWLNRPEAEISDHWVQAIPCAVVRDDEGRCCVLRRIRGESRDDLKGKLSLIIGGHIDEKRETASFRMTLTFNLLRELAEEIGLYPQQNPHPIGVIIDASSTAASRHVAFIHETKANDVSLDAPEEFMLASKYSGVFMDQTQLVEKIENFDPWSKMLIEDYVCRDKLERLPRQFALA